MDLDPVVQNTALAAMSIQVKVRMICQCNRSRFVFTLVNQFSCHREAQVDLPGRLSAALGPLQRVHSLYLNCGRPVMVAILANNGKNHSISNDFTAPVLSVEVLLTAVQQVLPTVGFNLVLSAAWLDPKLGIPDPVGYSADDAAEVGVGITISVVFGGCVEAQNTVLHFAL